MKANKNKVTKGSINDAINPVPLHLLDHMGYGPPPVPEKRVGIISGRNGNMIRDTISGIKATIKPHL
jgi:hypothetical protein